MTISQDIRKQANCIGANVADMNGDSIRDRLNELATNVEELENRELFLNCLEACGVDNWDGFDFAHELMDEEG